MLTGKTAATTATIDHAIFQVWNPSTTKRLQVVAMSVFKITAGAADEPVIRRTTARGTAGSTVTPTSVHQTEQIAAPPSGWLLDLAAFSAQPTLAALGLDGAVVPGAIGTGYVWIFDDRNPLEIPSANGIAVCTGIALAFPVSRVSAWVED